MQALALLLLATPTWAAELHYAPIENLERLDVQRLNAARKTIDMAAYVLTDWPIIGALTAAAYRGVKSASTSTESRPAALPWSRAGPLAGFSPRRMSW